MVKIRVALYVLSFTSTYLSQCKKYLIEVKDDNIEQQKDYDDTGIENEATEMRNETQNEEKDVTQGPQVTLDDIQVLKEGMEKVFGKNWTEAEVKEVFDQTGDYSDEDLEDSELFVSIDGSNNLLPMGRIKVK